MKAEAWAVVAFAALVAAVAWRHARGSRLALVIASVASTLAGLGIAFGALGYGGCGQRGDCGTVGDALRTLLLVAVLLLLSLLVFALVRTLWRRLVPRRTRRSRPRARADAPRMRRRDIGLAIFGMFMLLTSIAVVASNRSQDRPAGLAIALFAAGILCVPISGRLARRSDLRPRLERVHHDGTLQPALVLPGSLVKLRLLRNGLLCLAGGSVVMAVWPQALESSAHSAGNARFGGIVCAVLFGTVGLAGTLRARGPVRIELLPDALRWQLGSAACWVAWDDITGVRPFDIRGTWFLRIEAHPGSLRMPGQGLLARVGRAISRPDASISLEAFPVEPERLAEVLAVCAQDAEERRQIGTEPSLAWFADPAAPTPSGRRSSTPFEHRAAIG